ncbi:hypothetical protein Ae406Ps2_3570c [Pseudonocardia sp. Ae406_Ps2]|uniref:helix-turn-helix domain-containing protein n=1 Tax=unclassified Pseudonocardia TaxID=2619320 RepID=UPI000761223B|nr:MULTISPECIES: helix-turn-helix domain-containing protein [unclassified Pseudonocardia]OLL98694.1 hypothetical protein Ae331Ps2_2361 [Pseudonocardia sp. Ae331_Ps2]OLM03570.1 hypothetical protein Ae406Ps2_3570c [Pseudonocardia sp. Ae406_Ps2]OLM11549.1 hypothetical protein Ae505Ps2_1674 [Pseudonocardia sp. Ae505_Ps2]OLM25129.1 hypothetical protein Ae706Ps2_3562c [Pseudonocardia sp. Ae706_Ps2]OLM34650.1 hypothetical protein Ae717Ps2_5546 [Pseudonocardia sp. Ae717_Ps2]
MDTTKTSTAEVPAADATVSRPAFYTAAETAAMLRLDESTLYRHLRRGTFPGLKIGGRYVVPGAVLERLVADILTTGRCIDLGSWTEQWRHDQVAALARAAAADVTIVGGAS